MKNPSFRVSEVVILAGGFGTRLRPVVTEVPKPMAPVNGRPFLEYLLDFWLERGMTKFVLSVGYMGEVIAAHFGGSYRGAEVEYVHETVPLGTGGGIKHALSQAELKGEYLLVINGDTWFEVDFEALREVAQRTGAAVTLSARVLAHNDRYGGIHVGEEGWVRAFEVTPPDNKVVNGGCYLVNRSMLLQAFQGSPREFSFEKTTLVDLSLAQKCAASVQTGGFLDIGVPEDYAKAGPLFGQ